jgi:hypothetical protein
MGLVCQQSWRPMTVGRAKAPLERRALTGLRTDP